MVTLTRSVLSEQWALVCFAVLAVGGCAGSTQPTHEVVVLVRRPLKSW